MDNFLITVRTAKPLLDRILAQEAIAVTVDEMMQGENNLPKTQAAASRQAVADCIAKLKQGNTLLAKKIVNATLTDKDTKAKKAADKAYALVIKNWILMNPKDKREELYKDDKEILESHGIKAADLVDASDEPPSPSKDQLLLDSAKKDIKRIKMLIENYYWALFNLDEKALRATLAKNVTDKCISQMIAKSKKDKEELNVNELVSIGLENATIQMMENERVAVGISGMKVTLKSGDKTSTFEKKRRFIILKENERWVLWFK
jgi:hypothetical protein